MPQLEGQRWTRGRVLGMIGVVARVAIAAALLTFVLRRGVGRSLLGLLQTSPWLPALFTVQTIAGVWIEAKRLRLLFGCFGLELSGGRARRLVTTGAFFNACIPGGTGGDVMKYFFIGAQPGGRARVAAVLLVDRVVGLGSLLLAAVAAAGLGRLAGPYPAPARWFFGLALGGLIALSVGLWFLWSRRPSVAALRDAVLERLPFPRTLGAFTRAAVELGAHPGALGKAVLLSTLGQTLLAVAFAVAGRSLMPALSGLVVGGLGLLALVANVLPITPGGLGVGEVASNAIFRLAGASGGSELVLLWRMGAIPVIIAGGVIYGLGLVGGRASPTGLEGRATG